MYRTALIAAARAASSVATKRSAPIFRPVLRSSVISSKLVTSSWRFQAVRCYAASAGLGKEEITGRILDLLKNFDKVKDVSKLSDSAHFSNDLGLDSLDTVEVVMAIEEEFGLEMPDKDADNIHSVDQAVNYILSQPDAH